MRLDKRSFLSLVFGLSLVCTASQATAETSVLELFTSQGCSSCPPADRLFKQFSSRKNLVALSFNVDYWDYIGWKDTLAKPKFTARWRDYGVLRGDGRVYTPQVVINGLAHAVGSNKTGIDAALRRTSNNLNGRRIAMDVATVGDAISIKIPAAATKLRKPATVWIATVLPSVTVKIRRGENRGETITYYNVVRELAEVGMWSGEVDTIRLQRRHFLPKKTMRCAVLLQAGDGAILAARWLPTPKKP